MTNLDSRIKEFYTSFCRSQSNNDLIESCLDTPVEAWGFGDSSEMANELLAYVLSGKKTATSCLKLEFEHSSDKFPRIGDRSIILDGSKNPRCIVETIDVSVCKYNEVTEEFALKEGEGFTTLHDWKLAHEKFFKRRCSELKIEFGEELEVVCEEFKLVFQN